MLKRSGRQPILRFGSALTLVILIATLGAVRADAVSGELDRPIDFGVRVDCDGTSPTAVAYAVPSASPRYDHWWVSPAGDVYAGPVEMYVNGVSYAFAEITGPAGQRWEMSFADSLSEGDVVSATLSGEPWEITASVTVRCDGPASPAPLSDGLTRLSGASRYDTAVQVSHRFSPGVDAVFVATGENFPDALAAAAAAASADGPLLLTAPKALPDAVRSELERLSPHKIYVVGGDGAVSASIQTEMAQIAPVVRFGGVDRYDTGLSIVRGSFSTASSAFIATGRSFPDALAASGAAGAEGAPVILVDGGAAQIPDEVTDVLRTLGVEDVYLIGGTGVIPASMESQLQDMGFSVTRYGGADRYATTALINSAFFDAGTTDTILMATGRNFPDALAGAALAGSLGAPLYITESGCVPTQVHDSIEALSASKRAILGGEAVVSAPAANNWECAPGPLVSGTVSPGAFCSSSVRGMFGYTNAGSLMRCVTAPDDTRLRWRAA